MSVEVRELVRSFVGTGRPIRELLTAPRTVVPPRLAEHYRIGPSDGAEVDVAAIGRGGLLGTAAVLTALSHPDRGSSTRRGKFVLDRLLCSPPPPPPASIPALAPGGADVDAVLEHTRNPVCAGCHRPMEGLGLALDHFDGIGAWRDTDHGRKVEAVGQRPDGRALAGLADLSAYVADDPRYLPCVARQLFTWSLGRPPGDDEDALAAIVAEARAAGGSLDALVEALVASRPFRTRRGAP
jgi:hypothetical protein